MKKALLFGASGFIGSYLLDDLLNSPDYELVTIVVRKSLNKNHPKLRELIGDFHSLQSLKNSLVADDVFIALGTTKKNTPDQKEYYLVDHDYPVLAAKLAKDNGAKAVFVITAVGANAKSGIFYTRTKGEVERDLIALDLEHTHIFRPSMIMGNRKEKRSMEKFLIIVFSVLNPLLFGGAKKYRGIDGKDVAKAMVGAAKSETEKVKIYHWQDMQAFL